ncbi:MAG: sulfite exporter TauE/SafE family protein, partial [Alphaproteobacteria bacterium]|nr:sulfite exporter TauE/SafE family protein [Alphaproteobacteria bacterium]
MIADPWFYVLAVPALLLTGISKGGIGAGAGILSVPLMSLVIPPTQAAAIMLPVLCAMDLVGLWRYRTAHDRGRLMFLLPAALVGIGFGTLTFGWMPEGGVRVVIGSIAVVFVLRHWAGVLLKASGEGRAPGPRSGAFWAAV